MKTTNKILILLVIFSLILLSCRETKKEEPSVTLRTEKVASENDEENAEGENVDEESIESEEEYDSNNEESEIEESEEETDTLSVEE